MEHYSPKRPTLNGVKKVKNHVAAIGTTAYYAPLSQGNSASRLMMATVQSQQLLGVIKPDLPQILSGGESELAKYNFDDIMPCNAYVFSKVPYYSSMERKDIPFTLIYRNQETQEYDFIDVTPYMHKHTKFGHKKVFDAAVRNMDPGDILVEGQRLTRTANIHEGDLYSNTLNAKTFYCSSLGTTEDGFEVTPEFIERSLPLAISDSTASYGSTSFPVFIYGNEANPRPFPRQGEHIREDGMLYCLRDYDEDWDFLMTHTSQLNKVDRIFDSCMHGEPGAEIIDIEVLTTTNESKRPITSTFISEALEVYSNRRIAYSARLIREYTRIMQESKPKISLRLMRKFAEALIVSPNNKDLLNELPALEKHRIRQNEQAKKAKRFVRTNKNAELDEWTVKLTYAYRFHVTKGAKFSNKHGGKGVICKITPYEKMFRDDFGNVADICIFTKAVSARMNNDQYYEHAICAFLFAIQYDCRNMVKEGKYDEAFQHLLNAYQIVSPTTYNNALNMITTPERKRQHVDATCAEGKNIHVTIYADDTHINELMYLAIMDYRPPLISNIHFVNNHGQPDTLIKKGLIAPMCVGILEKTQHNKLAENTALTQHHGLPTSSSPKGEHASGIKQQAPKIISETECRAWSNNIGSITVAQLQEQANNSDVAMMTADVLFSSETPLGEPVLVDRSKVPMGGNSALRLIKHTFAVEGTEILGADAKSLSESIGWDK